jgi:hypothetical protein
LFQPEPATERNVRDGLAGFAGRETDRRPNDLLSPLLPLHQGHDSQNILEHTFGVNKRHCRFEVPTFGPWYFFRGMTPILRIPRSPRRTFPFQWVLGACIVAGALAFRLDGTPPAARAPVAPPRPVAHPLALRLIQTAESHSLDSAQAGSASVLLPGGAAAVVAERGTQVTIVGWAADIGAKRPSSAVYATTGGKIFVARVGLPRSDVAAALGDPAYTSSGFELTIDTASLPIGASTIAFGGVNADGSGRYDFKRNLVLMVTKPERK